MTKGHSVSFQAQNAGQTAIRPMQADDLAQVVRIEQANAAFPWTAGHFADSLAAGHACWSLWQGQAVIGFAIAMSVIDEMHILNLGVCPDQQRQGGGRRLLQWMESQAAASAHESMLLEVRPSNTAALGLYTSAGYTLIGRRKGYYPALEGREDALVMRKSLTARSKDE